MSFTTVRFTRWIAGLLAPAVLAVAPGSAKADSPFESFVAQGPFIISLGEGIHPAGTSGRFVVPSRRVFGFLGGSVNAPYMIQFATNVPIATQSGNIHGELIVCENGPVIPGLEIFGCLDLSTIDFSNPPLSIVLSLDAASVNPAAVTRTARVHLVSSLAPGEAANTPLLNVNGVFTFTGGDTTGHGDASGFLTLILDAEGHIVDLGASNLAFCGKWNGDAAGTACPFAQ